MSAQHGEQVPNHRYRNSGNTEAFAIPCTIVGVPYYSYSIIYIYIRKQYYETLTVALVVTTSKEPYTLL